jgi:hypothetical protein
MLSISGTREYVCYLTSRLGRMLLIFGTRPRNAEFAQVANAWGPLRQRITAPTGPAIIMVAFSEAVLTIAVAATSKEGDQGGRRPLRTTPASASHFSAAGERRQNVYADPRDRRKAFWRGAGPRQVWCQWPRDLCRVCVPRVTRQA